jgi:hypothetical protein
MEIKVQPKGGSVGGDGSSCFSPTVGLFAIAAALLVLAITIGNTNLLFARYQFAATAFGGEAVWRGDTVTGNAVLCATDAVAAHTDLNEQLKRIVKRC